MDPQLAYIYADTELACGVQVAANARATTAAANKQVRPWLMLLFMGKS